MTFEAAIQEPAYCGAVDHPHPGALVAPVLRAGARHLCQRRCRLHPGHLSHHAQHRQAQPCSAPPRPRIGDCQDVGVAAGPFHTIPAGQNPCGRANDDIIIEGTRKLQQVHCERQWISPSLSGEGRAKASGTVLTARGSIRAGLYTLGAQLPVMHSLSGS